MPVSLNLLSPEKKAEMRAAFTLVRATRLLWVIAVVVLFCAATIVGIRMMLAQTRDTITASVAGTQNEEIKAFAEKTKAINGYLKRIDGTLTDTVTWSHVLETLSAATPTGIRLSLISVEDPGKIHLTGMAETRADVLQMKSALEASPMFKDVTAPLSNILSQRNVQFDFDMTYVRPTTP